ncbi:hypothetical protein SAMN05660420_01895 [Desulfuromusa kysingii]|uniref:Ammonium transporter n=1 Tax=Desulfuromusa kysingii TaxID=37625 RepID=A0A1H4ALU8_9BACT|nr:hypothetical protein [Desulfuromusa kysingii]SEA36855.1 hypothetical protein SAMN05660420_01895 [Desulfuromusa kysingii]
MKRIVQNGLLATAFLLTAMPAVAATGTRTDNSMTLVYLFLGVCGLIIFLQMIPVFALGFGMIKGIFGGKGSEGKSVAVKQR